MLPALHSLKAAKAYGPGGIRITRGESDKSGGRKLQREGLQAYPALLSKQFSGEKSAAALAYVPHWLRNGFAHLLLKTQWFCRRVVVENWFLR